MAVLLVTIAFRIGAELDKPTDLLNVLDDLMGQIKPIPTRPCCFRCGGRGTLPRYRGLFGWLVSLYWFRVSCFVCEGKGRIETDLPTRPPVPGTTKRPEVARAWEWAKLLDEWKATYARLQADQLRTMTEEQRCRDRLAELQRLMQVMEPTHGRNLAGKVDPRQVYSPRKIVQ
jgi:hypothetical protein